MHRSERLGEAEASGDAGLAAHFRRTRALTEALVAPLSDADASMQSMEYASPAKWHLAHTTWFWETFLLRGSAPGYRLHDESWPFLFNSYYEAEGALLLIGMDLVKDETELLAAYDDAAGVTARFNLNRVARANRELGGDMPAAKLRHEARWTDSAQAFSLVLAEAARVRSAP